MKLIIFYNLIFILNNNNKLKIRNTNSILDKPNEFMNNDPAIKFMQSKYKLSQNIGNDNIVYKFDDDRYPVTTANCQNVS